MHHLVSPSFSCSTGFLFLLQVQGTCVTFLSWILTLFSTGTTKSTIRHVFFFYLLNITRSSLLVSIRWSIFIIRQIISCIIFSNTYSGFFIYHLVASSNFILLQNSQWFTHYYYLLFESFFHISVSWWFLTEVWVTAILLKSPGLFSVFWPISIMK